MQLPDYSEKELNEIRRIDLLSKRETTNYEHRRAGRSFIQSKTTRKVFGKGKRGKVVISHDQLPYPHSSTRQQARYARQIAAGQLQMGGVEGIPASVRRTLEKITTSKEYGRINEAFAAPTPVAPVRKRRSKVAADV